MGLNPGPAALDASTLPLGYRGGGFLDNEIYLSSKLHVITRQIGHANMDDTGKKHDAL